MIFWDGLFDQLSEVCLRSTAGVYFTEHIELLPQRADVGGGAIAAAVIPPAPAARQPLLNSSVCRGHGLIYSTLIDSVLFGLQDGSVCRLGP